MAFSLVVGKTRLSKRRATFRRFVCQWNAHKSPTSHRKLCHCYATAFATIRRSRSNCHGGRPSRRPRLGLGPHSGHVTSTPLRRGNRIFVMQPHASAPLTLSAILLCGVVSLGWAKLQARTGSAQTLGIGAVLATRGGHTMRLITQANSGRRWHDDSWSRGPENRHKGWGLSHCSAVGSSGARVSRPRATETPLGSPIPWARFAPNRMR